MEEQTIFNPDISDYDRFLNMVNVRFSTSHTDIDSVCTNDPEVNSGSYIRNTSVTFNDSNVWFYDRVDLAELLANTPYPYAHSYVMDFNAGLPVDGDDASDYIDDTFNLKMSENEIPVAVDITESGGPYYQWNLTAQPTSKSLIGNKLIYIRHRWAIHFDLHLGIFELPDFDTL